MCRILSMDLSLNCPAFAVVDVNNNIPDIKEVIHVNNNYKTLTHADKLHNTAEAIRYLTDKYTFDYIVRERGFTRFASTTQALFKVVGISDLVTFEQTGVKAIEEIPPTSVKVTIGGHGKASKDEVENGLRSLLSDEQKDYAFITDDESDAVAVALTLAIKKGLIK